MESKHKQPCPCPSPHPNQSTLKDISNFKTPNFKTPKRHTQTPDFPHSPFPQFFTASKKTPKSSFSSSLRRPQRPSAASRRLKAFEFEQTKSARKVQINKENSLKSLAKSLTVWLSFLLENPRSCGCDVSKLTGEDERGESNLDVSPGGKRDSLSRGGVGVDQLWRGPKRRRDSMWVGVESVGNGSFPSSMFPRLKVSLEEICSLDDLEQRMREYLSLSSCKEIFDVMTLVTKNIDEGRLKMKAHCPLVTDVRMKENSIRILMSYKPVWLRIGLYIVFGGDSLLLNGDVSSEQEAAFLKMVIEKQFLAHVGLAKSYVYNKLVDGLYRPGYFEKLGKVILKRFLLLVIILDRAKSQSSLPINYGIDGLDGGSPLLFMLQSKIKSSRQVISDFLSSEAMHGEGNLLAHLVIVGYKVNYHQSPLTEYDFKVTDLFEDLQDGVRLCRAIQLLHHDPSILTKIVVPSDNRKKNLLNCGTALEQLKRAGVPLHDEDGTNIIGEDVVSGDKELTISLLWNIFVHLQLPLLVNQMLLSKEITNICGNKVELPNTCTLLDMLLRWIQEICKNYDNKIENFSSLLDGKGMWCLLDFYFRREHANLHSDLDETKGEVSIMSAADYTDAVHNFILSQKLTSLLGNFPEVMQVSDILEHNGACNDRSVIILLVFLSSQLINKNMEHLNFHKLLGNNGRGSESKHFSRDRSVANSEADGRNDNNSEDDRRNFKAIMAWWREMAQQNSKSNSKPVYPALQNLLTPQKIADSERETAAKIIQCRFRGSVESHSYSRIKKAAYLLQAFIRAWLTVKDSETTRFSTINVPEPSCGKPSITFYRYITFMVDRHRFVKLKRSVLIIQRSTRVWISRKRHNTSNLVNAATVIQKCIRVSLARCLLNQRLPNLEKTSTISQEDLENDLQKKAASRIQHAWRKHAVYNYLCSQHLSASKIQSYYRGWLLRRSFMNQKQAAMKIQGAYRCLKSLRRFQYYRLVTRSVICIQSHVRGWIARRVTYKQGHLIVVVQSHCRGWMTRKKLFSQKEAVTRIQSAFRCFRCRKAFHYNRIAAIEIQRSVRGLIAQKRILGASCLREDSGYSCEVSMESLQSLKLKIYLHSILKLQRWWRGVLLLQVRKKSAILIQSHIRGWLARRRAIIWRGVLLLQVRKKSAILIQSHIRGWLARRRATIRRHRIAVFQSYCKGYLARKDSREKLVEICLKIQKSAANVDDGMRLINRLIAALLELLGMKSVTGILHTCATLDTATKYSQRCCEELVNAGAIDTLLKLVSSVSRSIPDQEVLRHTLSTLRNLARHPHLTETLIDGKGSIEIILRELLRNKGDGYFITSELLLNICSNQKGIEAIRRVPALVKRLHNHVEELKRKAMNEKRIGRTHTAKEQTERKLKEAAEILRLVFSTS